MISFKKTFTTLLFCGIALASMAQKPKFDFDKSAKYVKITTDYGTCVVRLYNETPKHRDNFLALADKHMFDSLLFHRVIKGFMIQGGDPDSKYAGPGQVLGMGDLGYTISPEFSPNLIHKKGALAAARDNNPQKKSSACQFYLVQGKKFTDDQLDQMETTSVTSFKYTPEQREIYKTIGGTPHLDGNYTVFGEVVKGLEIIDSVAKSEIDNNNRPLVDTRMYISILDKKEIKQLKDELKEAFEQQHK
jgi:cyclophilin family peptidyl-prolyl cis-trans isomerase